MTAFLTSNLSLLHFLYKNTENIICIMIIIYYHYCVKGMHTESVKAISQSLVFVFVFNDIISHTAIFSFHLFFPPSTEWKHNTYNYFLKFSKQPQILWLVFCNVKLYTSVDLFSIFSIFKKKKVKSNTKIIYMALFFAKFLLDIFLNLIYCALLGCDWTACPVGRTDHTICS